MSLAQTQRWFLDALIFPGRVSATEIESRLLASPKEGASARFAIYQHAYILRLCKCLAEQFPALCHALGEELFHDFACEYLRAYPSTSYTLYELGRRFAEYLEETRPDQDLPSEQREDWIDFMVDLARYEYELFRLFDAPGHEGGVWPSVDVPDARLIVQPAFCLGVYRYPVAWYYNQVRAGADPSFPPERTSHVAIVRRDFMTSTFPISRVQHLFLDELRNNGDVEDALARVAKLAERPLADVVRSWQLEVRAAWIGAGFFVERS